jgi:hypothetical protein
VTTLWVNVTTERTGCYQQARRNREEATGTLRIHHIVDVPSIILIRGALIILIALTGIRRHRWETPLACRSAHERVMSTLTVIDKRIDSAGGVKNAMEELRRARGTSARNPEAEHGCLEGSGQWSVVSGQ